MAAWICSTISVFDGWLLKLPALMACLLIPALRSTVDKLRNVVVTESGLAPIVAGVVRTGSADYLTIEIGPDGDENWLTSRLFLLAAILERSRAVRCVVFLGEKQRFIGAARTRDIRYEIGSRFLPYEASLASAHGRLGHLDINVFRGLNETLIDRLANNFLGSQQVSRTTTLAKMSAGSNLNASLPILQRGSSPIGSPRDFSARRSAGIS